MDSSVAGGPTMLIKKLGGMALLLLGALSTAFGAAREAPPLMALGIIFLTLGVIVLIVKIRRRNAGN